MLMYCSYLKLTITVLQYLLGRPVRFHDLAFFDPVIYESLRQLVLDSERQGADNAFALQVFSSAQNYRPSFRENKPKTLVFYD
jgi:hypothetical protein